MIIDNPIPKTIQAKMLRKFRLYRTDVGLWSVSLLTASMGLVNLWSSAFPGRRSRIEIIDFFMPIAMRDDAHVFAAICGFLFLMMAVNLRRRKRIAWWITMGACVVSIISHMIKGLDYEECILALVLMTQLIVMRPVFTARSDRPSIAQAIRHFCASVLFTLVYGSVGFYILDGHFSINLEGNLIANYNFGIKDSIAQTLAIFFTSDNAGLIPETPYAVFFVNSIYIVGSITMLYAIAMLLRPVLLKNLVKNDRQIAHQIIDTYGQSSLARLALLPDKEYYFSPSRQTVISFVVKGRSAIVLGDPIGPEEDRLETLYAFRQFCRSNDWYPAFYEVPGEQLNTYHAMGWHWIQIGEEAIVNLDQFHLKGKSNQSLRTAINRLTKTGHRFVVYDPPNSAELIAQLKPVSDEWLKHKKGSEKQFSISWFDRNHLENYQIAVVYDANDRIVAFSNLLSGYNKKEVTIDLMRYRSDVENGTMEFLFVSLLQHFKAARYDTLSFSLSPLAGIGSTTSAPVVERGLRKFVKYLNRFYNFNGLHQFKEKFQPTWEPRYLVFPDHQSLPEIALGLVRADSGDRIFDYLKGGN